MGGLVKVINDDGHFQAEVSGAGSRLVVVDFTASWYVIVNQIGLFP